jgi:orotate phosphoribosyltransferase
MVATLLQVEACTAERVELSSMREPSRVEYRLSSAWRLRCAAEHPRVAVVDDVIHAGSAVRSTLADLRRVGGVPVAIGTLLVLGSNPPELSAESELPLVAVAQLSSGLWEPAACPLCAAGVTLEEPS